MIHEAYSRLERAELTIRDQGIELRRLDSVKAERNDFARETERIDKHMSKQDTENARIDDHCKALDQYLDKYQPVRLEDAVTQHLDACLGGEERIKHKRYTDERMSVLYRTLLDDTGRTLRIQELIKEITNKARRSIEEEERQKRRLATLKDKEQADSLEDTEDSAEKLERADLPD